MSALTLERLIALEAAGTITPDLKIHLASLRRQSELERQLAEAEKEAAKPKRPAPIYLPEEPQAADDVLIVNASYQGLRSSLVATDGDQEYHLAGKALTFVPIYLFNVDTFNKRFKSAIDDCDVFIHTDWHAAACDPRTLVPQDPYNEQRSQRLVELCGSANILTLWFSSLTKNGGKPRKASDKLWRIGLTPTVVEASDAWTFIQNERAKVVKEREEQEARRRKVADAERKEVDRAVALENEKIRIKRAAQEAYRKAEADMQAAALAPETKTTSRRKSA